MSGGPTLRVAVHLPTALADLASAKTVELTLASPSDVGAVLDTLARDEPMVARRLRDETGALRRYVNVYVDGVDIRVVSGLGTQVVDGSVLQVVPSVAGG